MTTSLHGVSATVSCYNPLVVHPTLACGGTLNRLMNNVHYLVMVAVDASLGNSDHSPLRPFIVLAGWTLCTNQFFHVQKDKRWFPDQCRRSVLKHEAHSRGTPWSAWWLSG